MTNKTITLPHCRVQVVEVPEGVSDIRIIHEGTRVAWFIPAYKRIDLPSGNWQLIGVWPEITEEQAAMVVDSWDSVYKDGTKIYQHYPDEIPKCRTALKSLRSLLTANNLDPHKRWAILKDKNKE